MKKLIVLGIIATMVMGMAVAASAAIDTQWALQLRAYVNGQSGGTLTISTKPGYSDGAYKPGEETMHPAPKDAVGMIASTLPSPEGVNNVARDFRAPISVGETKVWDLVIYVWGLGAGTVKLDGWVNTGLNMIDPSTEGDPDVLVQLWKGDDVIWTAPMSSSGSATAPQWTTSFAIGEGYTPLRLVASTIVPEPGSMVALFSGLVGLVGFGIRRRK